MHKITKGLKKKKKGKKSKHKEEELFKPEELEAYRREHQEESSTGSASGQNEEWKKFLALTSGVDDILKKTQGDLDRIKSTSFFQRVPPPSQLKKQEQESVHRETENITNTEKTEDKQESDIGLVQVSESESEEDEDDDIFDTTYIDAIAAGEVKLAYIPESPTEQVSGDDPFDTSIAERAILGPAVERKGKKLVPIGAAVEILTGRVQISTCATARPSTSNRRRILQEKNLLLSSFDENVISVSATDDTPQEVKKTLLDEDTPGLLADEPIDLSKTLHPIHTPTDSEHKDKKVIDETRNKENNVDQDDEEFAALAAESLAKTSVINSGPLPVSTQEVIQETEVWAAFDDDKPTLVPEDEESLEDPFDTTFAENILPGKAELKLIEDEILKAEDDVDFDPRAEDKLSEVISKVSIKITDPTGQRESVSSLDRVSEKDLNLIKPIHRDLLGGSNTDLSNLSDQPLKPSEQIDENYIEYCDPFDTSIVESAQLPGQTELKFLEKELLGDLNVDDKTSDEEFDPRAEEPPKERTLSRPDVLNIAAAKTVSFDVPSPTDGTLLELNEQHSGKVSKPLTPFYVRKSSVPEYFASDEEEEEISNSDPFDTSFVCNIGPGKVELKLIENELFDPATERNLIISDQNFDPRDERKAKVEQVVQSIKNIVSVDNKIEKEVNNKEQIDLLCIDHQVPVKVLTPAAQKSSPDFETITYSDPFDTSIASNILPGKTELKLLETELIHSDKENVTDQDFDPRSNDNNTKRPTVDLLNDSGDTLLLDQQPLDPVRDSFDKIEEDTTDPFDTSIANTAVPGRIELKLLESELI